jgi:hypothetical protein
MIKAIRLAAVAQLEDKDSPALINSTVAHCVSVWTSTREESLADGKSKFDAGRDAALAYCAAMPPLSGHQNISDFIACVGYSMAIGIIQEERATNLLNAARIAHSTSPKEKRSRPSAL